MGVLTFDRDLEGIVAVPRPEASPSLVVLAGPESSSGTRHAVIVAVRSGVMTELHVVDDFVPTITA
jgi:hypothetical protein